jgi:hypothetical protein
MVFEVGLTLAAWPTGAALLACSDRTTPGGLRQDAGVNEWAAVLDEVRHAGFAHLDLTDTGLRPDELSQEGR